MHVMRSILVVEDEKISSMLLEHLLSQLGFDICGTAATGAEAIQKAESSQPDLIVMDVGLKGNMNGIEAAHAICQRQQMPILFLTAYTYEEISRNRNLPKTFGFLSKPVMMEELGQKLIELFLQFEQMQRTLENSQPDEHGE
jgi:CheY-like chemotaxis protein